MNNRKNNRKNNLTRPIDIYDYLKNNNYKYSEKLFDPRAENNQLLRERLICANIFYL
jgi:hypothetical protein